MTNNKVLAARRQAHLKTSGVFKRHQREEVCELWYLETSSPPGRGDKASFVLSWACLFPVESPWKLSERPLSPPGGDQGLGRVSPGPAMPSTTPTLRNLSWRKRSQTGVLWDLPHIGLPPASDQMQNTALPLRKSQQLRGCGFLSSCPRVHRLHGSKEDEKRPKLKPEVQGGSGASPSMVCVSGGLVGPQDSHLPAQ